jgi:hypothetical protein
MASDLSATAPDAGGSRIAFGDVSGGVESVP